MWFEKGRSGNPGGRPKGHGDLRELAREHTMTALRTLAEIAEHGENESARVSAANGLLDRGWGKPRQELEHSGPDGKNLIPPPKADPRRIALAILNVLESARDAAPSDQSSRCAGAEPAVMIEHEAGSDGAPRRLNRNGKGCEDRELKGAGAGLPRP